MLLSSFPCVYVAGGRGGNESRICACGYFGPPYLDVCCDGGVFIGIAVTVGIVE